MESYPTNRQSARSRRTRGLRNFIWILPVGLLAFVLFVLIRMATLDVLLDTVLTFEAPKPAELSDLTAGSNFAVAVNGNAVALNGSDVRSTASLAKMILALAVMEKKPFDLGETGETIVISQEMYDRYNWYSSNNGSTTGVKLGEEISEYDALTSALLASSNNMADSLAIWAFGSLDDYRTYAQEMLGRIGAVNTTVGSDASGFSESTTSTASDLALLGAKVLDNPVLAEIVGKTSAVVPVAGTIENTNKLLGELDIVGVKTGYNGLASGYCLVSGYRAGESVVTLALLGASTREQSFNESKALIQELQTRLEPKEIVAKGVEVAHYDSWWAGRVPILTVEEKKDVVYEELMSEIQISELNGKLLITSAHNEYEVLVKAQEFPLEPSLWQRFLRVFGWSAL